MDHTAKMSDHTQSNAQSGQIILTIPNNLVKLDNELEKQHLLKMFPKKIIFTLSVMQLVCAAIVAILQVCSLLRISILNM